MNLRELVSASVVICTFNLIASPVSPADAPGPITHEARWKHGELAPPLPKDPAIRAAAVAEAMKRAASGPVPPRRAHGDVHHERTFTAAREHSEPAARGRRRYERPQRRALVRRAPLAIAHAGVAIERDRHSAGYRVRKPRSASGAVDRESECPRGVRRHRLHGSDSRVARHRGWSEARPDCHHWPLRGDGQVREHAAQQLVPGVFQSVGDRELLPPPRRLRRVEQSLAHGVRWNGVQTFRFRRCTSLTRLDPIRPARGAYRTPRVHCSRD
jgi:hypothetical protein